MRTMTLNTSRRAFIRQILSAIKPDKKIWVDEWSEDNRVLPADTPEPGPFRNTRTPYLVDIQRTMSPASPYREGWWQKPHQVGGSVTGENLIGAWICNAAGSLLVVFPTLDDARQWELTRFEPMRTHTRALRKLIKPPSKKGANNTKLRKKFPGGTMRLVGANRVGALKSATIRYVKFEEPDEYVLDLGEQGSPIDLAKARTSNFGNKAKIFGDGTPTIAGRSAIEYQVKRGDQRKWHLFCPSCGHPQTLEWKGLVWEDGNPDTAKYCCSSCGCLHTEVEWKAKNYRPRPRGMTEPEAKERGFAFWEATAEGEPWVASWCGFNALGAPLGWRPWPSLVREFLESKNDSDKLKTFVNNMLGQTYEDNVRSDVGADTLQQRAEDYNMMTCPAGGLSCTCGVDTQDNRLAVSVWGWGYGEESWVIYHTEIYGNPSRPEVWMDLLKILDSPIQHANGQTMTIEATGIDTGGHHAEDVYAFVKAHDRPGRRIFALKGSNQYDAPKIGKPKSIDFTYRGTPVKNGVKLRLVGTQSIKNVLESRLGRTDPGPGYMHFPKDLGADFYKQFRSEKREWMRYNGRKVLAWVCPNGVRNESWDCGVYAYSALLINKNGIPDDTYFRVRFKVFGQIQQPDLFESTEKPKPSLPIINKRVDDEIDVVPKKAIQTQQPVPPAASKKKNWRNRFLNRGGAYGRFG